MDDKFVCVKMPDGKRVGYMAETFGEWGIVLWRVRGALNVSLVPVADCSLRIPDYLDYVSRDADNFRRWWGQHSERVIVDFTDWFLSFALVNEAGS